MKSMNEPRGGSYIPQKEGIKAYIPKPLRPDFPLKMDAKLQTLLSAADRAIGRLDAATELLPNPDLFVAMYVRREAVFSSQIEGTQASLIDLLEYEAESARIKNKVDLKEVVNYVKAINYGLMRLADIPLSLRLIKEIHTKLLEGVRGSYSDIGEFRRSQNWIGPPGCSLSEAIFIPPPPQEVMAAMGNLELFLHNQDPMPPLIKCGLAHAQFETIHPFLDGNGRIGRLLITFILCWRQILKRPLLYISDYFKRYRDQYYQKLQGVRDRDEWEEWIEFFLEGVRTVAIEATDKAREIQLLRDNHRDIIGQKIGTTTGLVLIDKLFETPFISINRVAEIISRSYPVANDLIERFVELGLLTEITGQRRNRVYSYGPYLNLFDRRDIRV